MTDPRALAELIEGAQAALLADWRSRVRNLPERPERPSRANAEVPAFLAGGRASLGDSGGAPGEIDGASLISRVVAALDQDAGGRRRVGEANDVPGPAGDSWLRDAEQIGALRACLHDFLADRGLSSHNSRAFELVNRELDRAICRAVQRTLRGETDESRRTHDERLAFVAHDIKAPLNAIALAADVLERVLPAASDDGLARRMLRSIHRNVEQLSVLAEQVLETNAAPAGASFAPDRRPVDLGRLVQTVVQELEPLARSSETRVVNVVPEGLIVNADGDLLARVFQNLISNAIDHAPGGEVVVGAETSSGRGAVVCWVRDDGAGIAANEIGRVFRKGETTRPEAGAHGFGLPIVERVVEAHGGRVVVESAEGFGATFWFELPALATGAKSPAY